MNIHFETGNHRPVAARQIQSSSVGQPRFSSYSQITNADRIEKTRAQLALKNLYESREKPIQAFSNRVIAEAGAIQYTGRHMLADIHNSSVRVLGKSFTELFYLQTKYIFETISLAELTSKLGKEDKAAVRQAVKEALDCGLVRSFGITSKIRHKVGMRNSGLIQLTELGRYVLSQPVSVPVDAEADDTSDKPAAKSGKSLD